MDENNMCELAFQMSWKVNTWHHAMINEIKLLILFVFTDS